MGYSSGICNQQYTSWSDSRNVGDYIYIHIYIYIQSDQVSDSSSAHTLNHTREISWFDYVWLVRWYIYICMYIYKYIYIIYNVYIYIHNITPNYMLKSLQNMTTSLFGQHFLVYPSEMIVSEQQRRHRSSTRFRGDLLTLGGLCFFKYV